MGRGGREAVVEIVNGTRFGGGRRRRRGSLLDSAARSSAAAVSSLFQRGRARKEGEGRPEDRPVHAFSRSETEAFTRERGSLRTRWHIESFLDVAKKLGSHLHRYRAADRDPRKVGRAVAASLDAWARRILPVGFLIYLILEFSGLWAETPILQKMFSEERMTVEIIEKRDALGPLTHPLRFRMYPKTPMSNPVPSEFQTSASIALAPKLEF